MENEMKLKILFRIPFTIYFLALAELKDYTKFKKKKFLCIAVKEFLDYKHETNYYFTEISRHKHIEQLH